MHLERLGGVLDFDYEFMKVRFGFDYELMKVGLGGGRTGGPSQNALILNIFWIRIDEIWLGWGEDGRVKPRCTDCKWSLIKHV